MRKIITLSLVLLLSMGCFITSCQKEEDVPDQNERAKVKAPVEKTTELPA